MTLSERNNVHIEGQGLEAMVFVHGFGCDQNMWRFVEPEFRPDFRTVRYDLTGCGHSDLSRYDFQRHGTLHGHAEDLVALLRELDLTAVTLVGHSVSASIGMLAAIQEPRPFRRLVMVAPSPRYLDDEGYIGGFDLASIESLLETLDLNYFGWAANTAPLIMGNPDRPQLGQELASSFCRNDPKIASHFARVTFLSDHRNDLAQCKQPSLILQCREDVIAPLAVGEYLHRNLPKSKLVIMKATGHCPNLSAPAETIAEMRLFLGECEGQGEGFP